MDKISIKIGRKDYDRNDMAIIRLLGTVCASIKGLGEFDAELIYTVVLSMFRMFLNLPYISSQQYQPSRYSTLL